MRMPAGTLRTVMWAVVAAALLCGCGYRFAGQGNPLLADRATIAIPYFRNNTYEPGAEALFTHAFVQEFLESRRLQVVPPDRADIVLDGSVQELQDHTIAYSSDDKAREYRIVVRLSVTVRDRVSGEVLWKRDRLVHAEEYPVGDSIAFTEAAKTRALQALARDLAERVHESIMQGF